MRHVKLSLAAAFVAIALLAPASFAAPVATGAAGALAAQTLDLASMLTFAMQDEQIARAEYLSILEKFGTLRPFSNIVQAEETHIELLKDVFAAHGIALPAYAPATPAAPRDWASALAAGRQAEIDNIAMYDKFLARDLPADVREVFLELKAASQNHLRAFTNGGGGRA